jgi:FkbM family methyltransferase
MPIPHYKIFYSQNREDLILAGFLRNVSAGFYVDVGANHPEQDSVTKLFYDKGWSGINVEPTAKNYAELCKQRPRDINIQAGLSSQPGTARFRTYANDGLSTFSADSKQMYESWQLAHEEYPVEVSALSEVLRQHRPAGDIHFLKVDAEGLELEILLGNGWHQYRPWVLCIERAAFQPRRAAIAAFLEAWAYTHVFFDGINDYLVANEKRTMGDEFSYFQVMILRGSLFITCLQDTSHPKCFKLTTAGWNRR